jgi:Co/Zn/Cd efflux system component
MSSDLNEYRWIVGKKIMVNKATFSISKMDCPSEEAMIRMKLEGFDNVENLEFDIPNRQLIVYSSGPLHPVVGALDELNLGAELIETIEADNFTKSAEYPDVQRKLLWTVLAINLSFFVVEIVSGVISNSMGLIADSLDMLADSIVYGLSLIAVGGAISRKKSVAKISGYFQITLAFLGFIEVIRRFIGIETLPDFRTMIAVSILALIANSYCLYLLQKSKSKEAHMQASTIFTSNDVIINLGVIVAAILVLVTNSNKPDLLIGTVVFIIVIRGALRILKLAR